MGKAAEKYYPIGNLFAARSLWVISLALLIPIVGLMAFSSPYSDDFANADWVHKDGVIEANLACYMGWGGRYFSNLMLGVANPLSYTHMPGEVLWIYRSHSLWLLLLLLVSFRLIISRLCPNEKNATLLSVLVIALGTTFIGNGFEWLYWLAGSYTYCLGLSFTLLCLFFLLEDRFEIEPDFRKSWLLAGASFALILVLSWIFRKPLIALLNPHPGWFLIGILILLFYLFYQAFTWKKKPGSRLKAGILAVVTSGLAIGSSEIFLFVLAPFAGLLALQRLLRDRKWNWVDVLIVGGIAVASGLNIFSPSTQARRNLQSRNLPDFDLGDWDKIESVLGYFSSLPLLWGLLFLALSWLNRNQKTEEKATQNRPQWLYVSGLSAAFILWICVVIPLGLSKYASVLPERARNPLFFLALLIGLVWFEHLQLSQQIQKWARMVGLMLVLSGIAVGIRPGFWTEAVEFLASGNGPKSNAAHLNQLKEIAECGQDTCFIQPNPFKPEQLLGGENAILADDPPSWKNYKSFSFIQYFGKKHIEVRSLPETQ